MLVHHVILLLLSWSCVGAIENERPPLDDVLDQVATASKISGLSVKQPDALSSLSQAGSKQTTASAIKASSIHYENANGFIPMTSVDGSLLTPSRNFEINATSRMVDDPTSVDLQSQKVSDFNEDDPAYSTEARMFLNLPGPGADRRSFDAQDGNEFEILKVTNETPAIANYNDFYENVKSNLNRNQGETSGRYAENEEPGSGRTVAQNQRTKERIKKIEKYLSDFHGEEIQNAGDSYQQYYSYGNANNKPANVQNKAIFEPEKVQSNFHQHTASSIYDAYGESPVSRQRTSSTLRSNYDDSGTSARNSEKSYSHSASKSRHVNSKPVVVLEPGNYKMELKYGPEQVVAKVSNTDSYRSQQTHKEPTDVQPDNGYDGESPVSSQDRYGHSYERLEDGDYSDDANDYLEITEKPRRMHKSRRRPYASENSKRLVKEHRGHLTDDLNLDDSRKHSSSSRVKLHRPKAKPSYWIDDDRTQISEESSEEQPHNGRTNPTSRPEVKTPKHQQSRGKSVTQWSQVAPNIEVSHSNGYQIDQIDKPKLLVPVNLNLVPLTNFDHSSALGNSQGFDFTNIPNFVTAAPMVSTPAPSLSTSQSVISPNIANPANAVKNNHNSINNNYGVPTSVPDIIVGQSAYQNPIEAVFLPHMNINNKFTPTLRTQYLPSTVAPMFAVTQTMSPNVHNQNPTVQNIPMQNFQTTASPRAVNPMNQNLQHLTMNPGSQAAPIQPQLLVPQSTLQSYPLIQTPYNGNSNYNILVNPNGLHGQNVVQQANLNNLGTTTPSPLPLSTTPQSNSIANGNLHAAESNLKKNSALNSNGQFLASASFSVGSGEHQQQGNGIANDNKFFLPSSNDNAVNNNNNYYSGNQNSQQMSRPQQHDNFYQLYRTDQNNNQKIRTYVPTSQVLPGSVHPAQNFPVNFNNQNYANLAAQLQEQQSVSSPNFLPQRQRDQNQQLLKAANDIFENTWKQLQQLQNNGDATKTSPYQHSYRSNDNLGSTSNNNANIVNALQSAKAHLPVLGTQNVEIVNPNIRPSPVDMTIINPYQTLHHYPAAVLTTPIPIFSTTAGFLTPRPVVSSTTGQSINLQNYVDSLTQIGAHSTQVNKLEPAPGARNQEYQRPLFNPINFVPNLDLMKSQSMLNSKLAEPLPHQLSLVPLIPGGNFFKNTAGAQSELVQKPRLSSDLEKYAEEMFKESMKTIYNTHKWNNDKRARGNDSAAELEDLAKLKSELQRFKDTFSDSKQSGSDVSEAHHSETKLPTAEPSRTTKKPELSISAIEQLFKSDFKPKTPSSSDSSQTSHHKNRPSRPNQSDHFNDFRNLLQLSDYLTPPRPNSFVSKSPFAESSKPIKKRPGSSTLRYNSNNNNNNGRPLPRPSSLVSRPASGPEVSASNHLESGIRADGSRFEKHQHRSGKYSRENDHRFSDYRRDPSFDSYPTFTTTSSPENEPFKPSSGEQSTKSDYYDINHPRMHNLLGLLMKNKQLPNGNSQKFFRDVDELQRYFDNEKRKLQLKFYDDTMKNFEKKADSPPANMGPPAPPKMAQIRYYPG